MLMDAGMLWNAWTGMLESWMLECQECWNAKMPECLECYRMPECWNAGMPQECWNARMPGMPGMPECWKMLEKVRKK